MLGKMTKESGSQGRPGRVIEVVFRGKNYIVYSPRQLEACVQIAKLELLQSGMSEADLEGRIKDLMEQRGLTTMADLLAKATPEEKTEIEHRYRYGATWRRSP